MLEVRNLSASYGMHRALSGINVQVEAGEIVVILGANGAGKSSLLKAIAGMSEGEVEAEITLDGSLISDLRAEQIVERGIAFVPEGRGIFGDLTVAENLMLGAYSSHARAQQEQNLDRVFTLFPKLRERRSQISRTMSGGEQQMVAIGRAMMSAPQILMLDEPSLGLSPLLCKELFANLKNIRETGLGVLLVEQNARQSLATADRGYLIENGEIIGQDTADRLLNDPAVQSAYLGGASAATKPPQASAQATPSGGDMTFIKPRTDGPAPGSSSDTHAGEGIGELVARAAQSAQNVQHAQASTPVKSTPVVTLVAEPERPPKTGSPLASTHADPAIAKMLADMESAAQSARLPHAGSTAPAPEVQNPSIEPAETLPEIPVFRKAKVEIYRRGADDLLHKVEKK